MQIKTNEAASNIDVQLKKRRDTLVKLVDTLSSSAKFEKGLLTDVTKLRGTNNFNPSTAEGQANRSALDRLFANVEAYPQVQTTAAFRDMMSSADYIEREIAASRRVYNAVVTEFNQELYA
jgi:LemA protein